MKSMPGIEDPVPVAFKLLVPRIFITAIPIVLITAIATALVFPNLGDSWGCRWDARASEELECRETNEPNYFGGGEQLTYIVINLTEEKIRKEKLSQRRAKFHEKKDKIIACYDAGEDIVIGFDLKEDYNLTCEKLKYVNDHFLITAEKRDGGSISSSSYSSGLFHSNSHTFRANIIAWVGTSAAPTGELPKELSYHLDCENTTFKYSFDEGRLRLESKDTTKLKYYSESDLIMYYTDNCVEAER